MYNIILFSCDKITTLLVLRVPSTLTFVCLFACLLEKVFISSSPFLVVFLGAVLDPKQNDVEDTEIYHLTPAHPHASPPPLSTPPISAVHLLQLLNLN